MALLKIEVYGSQVLREKAKQVTEITPEIKNLIGDMIDTMRRVKGAGIAANQVGVPLRICVLEIPKDNPFAGLHVLINPQVIFASDEVVEQEEGCLSIPKLFTMVSRPRFIRVEAKDMGGDIFELSGEGFLTKALLHEIDHLDGILYLERVSPLKRQLLKRKIRKMIENGDWDNFYPEPEITSPLQVAAK